MKRQRGKKMKRDENKRLLEMHKMLKDVRLKLKRKKQRLREKD